MMEPHETAFPPIRACIFDMDGLLIDSEDVITLSINQLLSKYGKPALPPSVRAQLMGIPNSSNGDVFHNWAQLPISREQYAIESREKMRQLFPGCMPLPGAERLLNRLSRARVASSGEPIELALASGTKSHSYELKTSTMPETKALLNFFRSDRRVLGDDPRVPNGRGKPAPDIYLAALQSLNMTAGYNRSPILPSECLVFEDSVVGVEAARRAGMRVIWVPHPDIAVVYQGREKQVLAGRMGLIEVKDNSKLGDIDDGWAESISNLDHFEPKKYGIDLPPWMLLN